MDIKTVPILSHDEAENLENVFENVVKLQNKIQEEIAKISLHSADIPQGTYTKDNMKELYGILEEHSIYQAKVKVNKSNIEHVATLFTGFDTGSYWMIYNNTYDTPRDFNDIYSIEILSYLAKNCYYDISTNK
jgi:hypothetical protein